MESKNIPSSPAAQRCISASPIPRSSVGSISLSTARAMLSHSQPIPRSSVGSISLSTARAMLSNSQGEVEDKLTHMSAMCLFNLGYQKLQAMYAKNSYNFDCNFATEKGEFKDKHTKLIKELLQTMSAVDLCYAAWKELQAMSATEEPITRSSVRSSSLLSTAAAVWSNSQPITRSSVCSSSSLSTAAAMLSNSQRKYGAGTSKGKEKMEGEGDQDEDMFEKEKRSILEPAGALSLDGAEAFRKYCGLKGENEEATTSGANMNFDRLRSATDLADVGRQREAVQEEPGSFEKFSELRKYEAGTRKGKERMEGEGDQDEEPRSLPKEELEDDELLYAIPTSEERECRPEVGTTGSASHVSYNINFFSIIANTSASLRLAWNNSEERGNDVEVRRSLEEREFRPEVGTMGSASHISYNINFFSIIANTSASARLARDNREMRGNDVEVSGSR